MNFTINREQLLIVLNDVMKGISTKTTIPILTGIKLELSTEGLKVTGSNSDITIQSHVDNEEEIMNIVEEGSVVLQARMFTEIIRKLPANDVEIKVGNQFHTHIQSGKSEFHLVGLDAIDYPSLPEIKESHQFVLPANILKSIIRETVFAVSTSESRPVLTGVQWSIKDNELICIATDSHRLAKRVLRLDDQIDDQHSAIIPGKSLSELSKLLGDSSEPIHIALTTQQILFKTSKVLFFSRLLEGNFPDTSRLIPTEYQTTITLNGKSLFQAIDRASLLAREERNNIVQAKLKENNVIEISSNSPEIGKVEEEVQTTSIEGEDLKISFSAKYIMDALRSIDSQEVTIQFTGGMRPFVLKSDLNDSVIQLIVPVRTY